MDTKRGRGRGSFIDSVLGASDSFYGDVLSASRRGRRTTEDASDRPAAPGDRADEPAKPQFERLLLAGWRRASGRAPSICQRCFRGLRPPHLEAPVDAMARSNAYRDVAELADWSPWAPFTDVVPEAPRLPGVYLFREPVNQVIRYAGMAGVRNGSGRPQGLYGRLSVYRTGKGLAGVRRGRAGPGARRPGLGPGQAGSNRSASWPRRAWARSC